MRIAAALLSASLALWGNAAAVPSGSTPNISGTWQGTLQDPAGNLRMVFQISRDAGAWKATMYSIDEMPDQFPAAAVSLSGSKLRIRVDLWHATYEGTVSADGSFISGTWTQGSPAPLDLRRATRATAWPLYDSAHKVRFVTVDHDVKLEVLDWGGTGRPVILLSGLGNTAHVFDRFAPKLTAWYHVYGITRRGFGASSAPATGYSADRLGQDVLAVMHALEIDRPVLIGHSIAGEELSYIGSRYPRSVAGLVYLEAGYGFAFSDEPKDVDVPFILPATDLYLDAADFRRKVTHILFTGDSRTRIAMIDELLDTDLPQLRKDLQTQRRDLQAMGSDLPQFTPIEQAILTGMYRFTKVSAPILAIYADPHAGLSARKGTSRAEAEAQDEAAVEAQIAALRRDDPSARIVRLPNANHYVFISNEAAVLRDVHAFIDTLPASAQGRPTG